jgi:hypothetical protein
MVLNFSSVLFVFFFCIFLKDPIGKKNNIIYPPGNVLKPASSSKVFLEKCCVIRKIRFFFMKKIDFIRQSCLPKTVSCTKFVVVSGHWFFSIRKISRTPFSPPDAFLFAEGGKYFSTLLTSTRIVSDATEPAHKQI